MCIYIYIHIETPRNPPWDPVHQGKGAGTGTAAYSSVEEVAQAIATLNGWPSCYGWWLIADYIGRKLEKKDRNDVWGWLRFQV